MKKWFLIAFLGILSTSVVFISCQKDQTQPNPTNVTEHVFSSEEQELLEHLKSSYVPVSTDRRWNWKKFFKIIGADLLGGLAGAAAGSGVPGIGTTGGFVIGAVGSSLEAAGDLEESPSGNGGQAYAKNPFDQAGFHHNAGLAANLDGFKALKPEQRTNKVLYTYGEDYVVNVLGENRALLPPVFFQPTSEVFDLIRAGSSFTEIIQQLLASGRITPIMAEVCTAYYENVLSLPTASFYETSVRFEEDVMNSMIADADKNVILGSLAVGRYSRGFWGEP